MNINRNSSDIFFDSHLPNSFQPSYFNWQHSYGMLDDHLKTYFNYIPKNTRVSLLNKKVHIYQNPLFTNKYVVRNGKKITFMHQTGAIHDFPITHRLMGPAVYTMDDSKLTGLKWFLNNKEYSEYNYWKLMCTLFADQLEMSLSGDETRYYISNERFDLPFPDRLNLPIGTLNHIDDQKRTELGGHAVWKQGDREYVNSAEYWFYWENKGYDLKQLF